MPGDHTGEEFEEQLRNRIASYRALRDRVRQRVAELQEELQSVEHRLRAAVELYEAEFGGGQLSVSNQQTPSHTATQGPLFDQLDGPFTQLSWGEAIVSALIEAERPLHVKEIWEALSTGGFQTESRDPIRSIVAIAIRHPGLTRVAPNVYGLVTPDMANGKEVTFSN